MKSEIALWAIETWGNELPGRLLGIPVEAQIWVNTLTGLRLRPVYVQIIGGKARALDWRLEESREFP